MTLVEYEKIYEKQNGLCAICKEPEIRMFKGNVSLLAVDRDHAIGKNRELLCSRCNLGLGHFRHDPQLLQAAKEYMEKHNAD